MSLVTGKTERAHFPRSAFHRLPAGARENCSTRQVPAQGLYPVLIFISQLNSTKLHSVYMKATGQESREFSVGGKVLERSFRTQREEAASMKARVTCRG